MDRKSLELAANLLAKARSTDFDVEAVALVEKSYVLLAKVITDFDESADASKSGPRRRERRHLRDRRATRRMGLFGGSGRSGDPAVTYRQLDEDLRSNGEGHIDFKA
jgi:hypothetical protein